MAWLWAGGTPEILALWTAGGRLYLAWTPVTNAAGYRVESAVDQFTVFVEDLSGVYAGETWNCPVPATESMFYRVAATSSP